MIFEVEMCPERGGYVSFKSNIMHIGLRSFVITLGKSSHFGQSITYAAFCGEEEKREKVIQLYIDHPSI